MVDNSAALLTWAGKGLDCARFDDGWTVVEAPNRKQTPLWADAEPISAKVRAVAVTGQRTTALRALKTLLPAKPRLVYIDLPRLGYFKPEDPHIELTTWLTLIESHVKESFKLLAPDGFIVVHVDEPGAAYVRALLDDVLGTECHFATSVWQKKYSPQNDLKGRIDDAQDLILVYSRRPDNHEVRFDTTWWPYELAGKTEDATRQFEKLRNEGVITLPTIPKTSKPQKLISLLLEKLTAEGDYIIELFSDTGFASIAALTSGRIPIYMVGDTQEETEVFNQCGKPAIEHALHAATGKSQKLLVHDIARESIPKRVRLDLRESPVVYAPAVKGVGDIVSETMQIRPMLVHADANITFGDVGLPSSIFEGLPADVLTAIEATVRCDVRLAWCDLCGAQAPLAAVRPLLEKFPPLLQAEGVMAVKVDVNLYATVRLVCDGLFGKQQHVGTIALKVPKNDAGDYAFILVYRALPPRKLRKVGLATEREFKNTDSDPRGAWRDPGHKGARSGSAGTAFPIRIPPYRWDLVKGELPPGCWRINPWTGVIHAPRLEKAGTYKFTARVTDSAGRQSSTELSITVQSQGGAKVPDEVWFLSKPSLHHSATAPRIVQSEAPVGIVGEKYSWVLEASGGQPYDEIKLPGQPTPDGKRTRYWEFGKSNFITSLLEDRVNFGARGTSSPSLKVYEKPGADGGTSVELGWWDEARLGGLAPLTRLLNMFTKEGDLILSLAPPSVDIVPNMFGRRWLHIVNSTTWVSNPSGFWVATLGAPVATFERATRRFTVSYDSPNFCDGIAWVEGFLPLGGAKTIGLAAEAAALVHGVTADQEEAFHLLPADEWLATSICERLVSTLGNHFKRVHVYYFRGDPPTGVKGLAFHRIPFALNCRPKG